MTSIKKLDLKGNGYIEVNVMDFTRERIYHVNFNNVDVEQIPDTLREYIRENSEKIIEGRWDYTGVYKK